ncbi:hypothetical protein [Thermodesulfobacterium hydrogeniphilum]|uniref:hypothetical protein n=1 Tax=Thermodesulfobacterium hydrogeniphilum TaxID=161156 RepID=UPI00056F472D|nr:hypothetical protein [Thermodesulfobacterium hydrogeniphilum]
MKIKKYIYFLLFLFLLASCSLKDINLSLQNFKDIIVERTKVFLNNIPLIKKYISLPPAPKKLYKQTENIIEQLKTYGTQKVYKDEYEEVIILWKKAKDLYQNRYYLSAKKELKKLYPKAKDLLEKIKAYKENVRKEALQKYKALVKRANLKLSRLKEKEEKLKIKLYLWKLKILLTTENYNEFNEAIKNPPF